MSMSLSDSHSNCRILTVSTSLGQALAFIQRVREHSRGGGVGATHDDEPTALGELVKVPWTITNKYYSADVHFAAHTVHGLTPDLVRDVPAVLFVWTKGEPYRLHVERLAREMEGCEPEVSLAVRIKVETTTTPESEEEEGEIDEFLSSQGFEYVYVTDEAEAQFSDGVPNFPRVIDALSTIMWPSMQAKSHDPSRVSPMFNWEDDNEEESPTLIEEEMGFEDDFTEFVKPGEGDSYTSLGSEFGSDDGREEIEETTNRIFGRTRRPDDLGGVMGRLEEMKAEIGRIENADERRKAAAVVALGVVYGL